MTGPRPGSATTTVTENTMHREAATSVVHHDQAFLFGSVQLERCVTSTAGKVVNVAVVAVPMQTRAHLDAGLDVPFHQEGWVHVCSHRAWLWS